MAISLVLTDTVVVLVGGYFALFTMYPLLPLLAGLTLFAVLFPIAFYRPSRGLWTSFIYLTGDNLEHE